MEARNQLGTALSNLGGVVGALDDPAAARPLHEEVVEIMRGLAEEQPTQQARRNLATALNNLGSVVRALDGPAAARPLHEKGVQLMRGLAEEHPNKISLEELIRCLELFAECSDAEGFADVADLSREEIRKLSGQ